MRVSGPNQHHTKEGGRASESERESAFHDPRERERERKRCACVCVCVWTHDLAEAKMTESVHYLENFLAIHIRLLLGLERAAQR